MVKENNVYLKIKLFYSLYPGMARILAVCKHENMTISRNIKIEKNLSNVIIFVQVLITIRFNIFRTHKHACSNGKKSFFISYKI